MKKFADESEGEQLDRIIEILRRILQGQKEIIELVRKK